MDDQMRQDLEAARISMQLQSDNISLLTRDLAGKLIELADTQKLLIDAEERIRNLQG